ncbi:MAG TPA: TolC family protein [Vicinamibacterales bacterium]|nr:TolC family protein [Vicinamibacterales bacterium]
MRSQAALSAAILLCASTSAAQEPLTLTDAMERARTSTPEARAAAAAELEAAARVREARAGYLPRVDLSESVQRGTQPVFVFSSLLSQRRFAASNFAIPALNEPDALTNVRTTLSVEQTVFDAGATRHAVRAAALQRDTAAARAAAAGQDLAWRAAEAFVRVLQLDAVQRAARAAVEAADSDLQRARARRETGLATPADVLAVEVHLADAYHREITARADAEIARLQLAAAIGAPTERVHPVPPAVPERAGDVAALVEAARTARADLRIATLAVEQAGAARAAARAAFLPRLDLQGGVEFNGGNFTDQRSSWIAGAQVRLNLFRGFADVARVAAATQGEVRARADRDALLQQVDLDVRAAHARLEAARAREAAGRAALAQAREAHRILRDRYDTGLATMTDVLRAAGAAFDAEARATAAELDVVLAALALERAAGRL